MKRFILFVFCLLGLWVAAQAAPVAWEVDCGTTVKLTATPESGYHFVKWDDENIENPRYVEVTADITYTAIFEANSTPTNVDTTLDEAEKAVKQIVDGQMYIIRNGHTYNAQGKLVK